MKKQKPLFYQNYYKIAEGRYSSYWLGKLINNFMFSGHKKTIMKNLDYTYLIIKLRYRRSPVVFILSALQKIRPLFKLKHVIIAGKRREFPSFLERSKQVNVSIK
jgi:ribosomal protein S7